MTTAAKIPSTESSAHKRSSVRFDVEKIRRDFPILARDVRGKKLVYLDNAATSQKPRTVIDAITHALLPKIQLPQGSLPMGTAISNDANELFVSTGRGNSVAVIDTAKNEVVTTIPVGSRVWGIALSPDGKKLYTANGASNDVSVVDLAGRKEVKRVKVGDGPWGIAIVPSR